MIFPDADAITGMESPPFGAGLSAADIADPELAFAGARAHNRFLVELCAHSPERRAGVALVPITHDVDRAVAEIEWAAANGLRGGIIIPTMWHDHAPYNDPVYDPVWAACAAADLPVHTHSGAAPLDEYQENIGIYLAEVVLWTHRPMSHLLFSGAFERLPDLKFCITEAAAYWVPDMKWKWDKYLGGGHTTKKMASQLAGKVSRLPPSTSAGTSSSARRRCRRGDPAPARDRHRHGHVGHRLPASRRHVAAHRRQAQGDFDDVPVADTELMLGGTAARVLRLRRRRAGADRGPHRPDAVGPRPGSRRSRSIPSR